MLLSNDYGIKRNAVEGDQPVRVGFTIHRPGFPGFEGAVGWADNEYNVTLDKQVSLEELAGIVEVLKTHKVSKVTAAQMGNPL